LTCEALVLPIYKHSLGKKIVPKYNILSNYCMCLLFLLIFTSYGSGHRKTYQGGHPHIEGVNGEKNRVCMEIDLTRR